MYKLYKCPCGETFLSAAFAWVHSVLRHGRW